MLGFQFGKMPPTVNTMMGLTADCCVILLACVLLKLFHFNGKYYDGKLKVARGGTFLKNKLRQHLPNQIGQ